MNIMRNDKVVLVKGVDGFKKVGETFEVANVTDTKVVLRDVTSKVAVGAIDIDAFETHFKKPEEVSGWTQWENLATNDEYNLKMFYRAKGKHVVQVKTSDGYMGESYCNNKAGDEFNLYYGLNLAYLRCLKKMFLDKTNYHQNKINEYTNEVNDIESRIKQIIEKF